MNKYIVHYNYNIYKLLTQALKKLKQIERKISIVHLIIWEKALFYIHVLANCYNHSSLSIGNVFVYVHILNFTLKFPLFKDAPLVFSSAVQNGVASSFVYIIGLKMAQNKRPPHFALNSLDEKGAWLLRAPSLDSKSVTWWK